MVTTARAKLSKKKRKGRIISKEGGSPRGPIVGDQKKGASCSGKTQVKKNRKGGAHIAFS